MKEYMDPETGEVREVNERLNSRGHETLDPNPMEIPAGFRKPETLAETVQRMVRGQISAQAEAEGYESFEEANDFDIPDDPVDPQTPYEVVFDPVLGVDLTPDQFRENSERYREMYAEKSRRVTREELREALQVELGPDFELPPAKQSGPAAKDAPEPENQNAADAADPVHST